MRGILQDAAARHVTVVAASGDSGAVSDVYDFGTAPVKEVSLPASDPFVLGVGGTTLTAGPRAGSYIGGDGLEPGTAARRELRLWRRVQRHLRPPRLPGRRPRYRGHTGRARRGRRRRRGHGTGDRGRWRELRAAFGRRHQRRHSALGRAGGSRGPVRRPRSGLRQPGPLPDRTQPSVRPGVPRCHHGEQYGGS